MFWVDKEMCETTTPVSLHEGSARKVFTAEVTNALGSPVKDVEIAFVLDGAGSLSGDSLVSTTQGRTDEMGSAKVSFIRPAGLAGRLGANLKAQCPIDDAQIRLRLVAVTSESR
jgi:hypothetical protein